MGNFVPYFTSQGYALFQKLDNVPYKGVHYKTDCVYCVVNNNKIDEIKLLMFGRIWNIPNDVVEEFIFDQAQ